MPNSESAQICCLFAILESNNFWGVRNIYPEMHDPSWFWQLFVFSLNSLAFVCLTTRDRFCKKVMQNEMIMFLHKWTSLRDFNSFLSQKSFFHHFYVLFPDWYIHETSIVCNEELRRSGVKHIQGQQKFSLSFSFDSTTRNPIRYFQKFWLQNWALSEP